MKVLENGIYRDITEEEAKNLPAEPTLAYEQRVVSRIREVYSVDDELAILRQRESKPNEFNEYNAFVEKIKEEEREESK